MASKRVMYRPAPQENVGQRKNRKPLSQGRLISGGENNKKSTHLVSGVEAAHHPVTKKPQSPFTSVSEKNASRQIASSQKENVSINRSGKSDPLDLSDSEDDLPVHYKSQDIRVHKQQPSEVLLIDASRQTKDPNQSEVDVMVGYERSPVRVVCHSPNKVDSQFRGSTSVSIKMDSVTKTREKTQSVTGNLSPNEPCRSLDNFNLLTQIEKDMKKHKIPQPNFDDSHDSDLSEKPVQDVGLHPDKDDDNLSVLSDTGPVKVTISSKSSRKPKSVPVKSIQNVGKTPQTAKKKSGRTVASRYLQSAENKVKSSLSLCTKPPDLKNVSRASRSMDAGPKSARKISRKGKDSTSEFFSPRTAKKTKSSREQNSNVIHESRSHTPDNSHMTTGGQTSTPTHDGSDFPHEIDASAIHPEISVLSTGLRKHLRSICEVSKNQSVLSNVSVSLPPKKKKQAKMTQQQLDLIYARYIQSLYLVTKAQRTREELEKQAMAQIQGIFTEVEKLEKKNHELDKELIRLRKINEVDQQTDLQRQLLGPIVSSLPQLTKEYETLAHALDTTRHQIPTKGIYIPDDEDQYQRDLEQALLESEQLLGELSVMIRKDVPSISTMSTALSAMEKSTEDQCQELVRCNEMIAATQSLSIQETSMKIQAIQVNEMTASDITDINVR